MKYKEYYAEVKLDSSADSFHGRVLGMGGVIDFYGTSIRELRKEFKKSVEDYLAWCQDEGTPPEKTWHGKPTFWPSDELRRRLLVAAAIAGESVNAWVQGVLDRETRNVLGEEVDEAGIPDPPRIANCRFLACGASPRRAGAGKRVAYR